MRYVFGECELDTERYELRRRGQVVALEPLALRVLAYFVQHAGQPPVTRLQPFGE